MGSGLRPAASMLAAGVLGTLVLVSLPIMVGGMVAQFGWDDRVAGWLGAADMAGSAVAALWVLRRVGRIDWPRYAYCALAVVVAGNLASAWAAGLLTLLAARFAAGFGNGVLLAIVFVGLCHARGTARLFGIYTFAQLVLQAAALLAAPALIARHGMAGFYLAAAAVSAASALLVRDFPRNLDEWRNHRPDGAPAHGTGGAPAHRRAPDARVAAALAAQAIYFLAPGAVWTYLERIGQGFALSTVEIGAALSVASIVGLAGAASVIALGARLGSLAPMAAGTLASLAAMGLLIAGTGHAAYLLAASLFNFSWNFTFPYQMNVLARLDATGAVATSSLLAQLCALALGPLVASVMLGAGGYPAVLRACIAAYLLSLLLFGLSGRSSAATRPSMSHG